MLTLTKNEAKRIFELIWQESSLHDLDAYQWGVIWKLAKASDQPASRLMLIQQEAEKAIDARLAELGI